MLLLSPVNIIIYDELKTNIKIGLRCVMRGSWKIQIKLRQNVRIYLHFGVLGVGGICGAFKRSSSSSSGWVCVIGIINCHKYFYWFHRRRRPRIKKMKIDNDLFAFRCKFILSVDVCANARDSERVIERERGDGGEENPDHSTNTWHIRNFVIVNVRRRRLASKYFYFDATELLRNGTLYSRQQSIHYSLMHSSCVKHISSKLY